MSPFLKKLHFLPIRLIASALKLLCWHLNAWKVMPHSIFRIWYVWKNHRTCIIWETMMMCSCFRICVQTQLEPSQCFPLHLPKYGMRYHWQLEILIMCKPLNANWSAIILNLPLVMCLISDRCLMCWWSSSWSALLFAFVVKLVHTFYCAP